MQNLFFKLPEKPKKQAKGPRTPGAPKKTRTPTILTCEECGLYKTCLSPKMEMSGKGKKKILIIAEAPGKEEDQKGTQLIGKCGQLLRETLESMNFDLDRDFWKTNAIICRPPDNRTPTNAEINACRKNLFKTIEEVKPIAIIVLGAVAWDGLQSERLSGRISGKEFSNWVGTQIPDQELKTWIFPTYHPSYVLRMENDPVVRKVWTEHLKNALNTVTNKEFPVIEYESKIETTQDEQRAIEILNSIEMEREVVAFDYETSGLKPHKEGHKIKTVSFSDGNQAWAFPMFQGKQFLDRLSDVLQNPNIKKVAHNGRFEADWTHSILGYQLKNLHWDTMIGAHCLFNIKPCGLKWLTYVNFGILGYDSDVEHFLKATEDGTNSFNRIDQAPIKQLLKYDALDSLFTFWLYKEQEVEMSEEQLKGFRFFMRGSEALLKAHQHGMRINTEMMATQKIKALNKMERAKIQIEESPDVKKWDGSAPFNFNSSTQLIHLCYDILKAKVHFTTNSGKPSADKEALEKMPFPFIKNILEYKRWQKVQSTYIGQFERECVNGVVRPFFNLTTVDTFRSSSDSPNFQNIPKRDQEIKKFIRKFIVPRPGHRLAEYDYKAMEVCFAACYNKDPNLIKYIEDPSSDMHRDVAAELFIKGKDQIDKVERNVAKNGFVFPAFYGSYFEQTAPDIWTKMPEATKIHLANNGIKNIIQFTKHVEGIEKRFWGTRFPVYAEWKEKTYREYLKKGYVDLYTGFRCYGPMKRNEVINYRVQGSAFHALLWTMTQVTKKLEAGNFDSYFIGQIHDAMIPDILPEEEAAVDKLIWEYGTQKIREYWDWICVPLTIEKEHSAIDGNWSEMEGCGNLDFSGNAPKPVLFQDRGAAYDLFKDRTPKKPKKILE